MTADTVGGVWSYAIDLCSSLAATQTEILLAVTGPKPSDVQLLEAKAIDGLHLVQGDFDLEWMPNAGDCHKSREWLRALCRMFDPDVAHINGYAHAAQDWACPVVVVAHSCVFSWWRAMYGDRPPQTWNSYFANVRSGLRHADAVVAPTLWMLEELERTYGVRLRRSHVIHNFSAETKQRRPKGQAICATGRVWDPVKNYRVLDEAAPHVAWPIQLLGQSRGPDGQCYTPSRVNFLSAQPKRVALEKISEARIFAHPSKYEPFGLCVLEAAINECALVLADIPTLRELWDGAALFVEPDWPALWVKTMNALIAAPQLLEKYGRLAVDRAKEYCAHNCVERYRELYLNLISAEKSHRDEQVVTA